jgi:hypothetical protein
MAKRVPPPRKKPVFHSARRENRARARGMVKKVKKARTERRKMVRLRAVRADASYSDGVVEVREVSR